jgi:hypothetical protein
VKMEESSKEVKGTLASILDWLCGNAANRNYFLILVVHSYLLAFRHRIIM